MFIFTFKQNFISKEIDKYWKRTNKFHIYQRFIFNISEVLTKQEVDSIM